MSDVSPKNHLNSKFGFFAQRVELKEKAFEKFNKYIMTFLCLIDTLLDLIFQLHSIL